MAFLTSSLAILLVLCEFTSGMPNVTNEELISLGMRCHKSFYSCAESSAKESCKCDQDCSLYGDCCFDSPYRVKNGWKKRGTQCVGNAYVTSKCPQKWDDEILKYYCETYINITEPLSVTPVLSLRSGVSYRNYYCASCHRDTTSLQLWPIQIKCNSSALKDIRLKDLRYERDLFTWGVWYRNSEREWRFVSCDIGTVPQLPKGNVRNCSVTVDKCAPDWNHYAIKKKCESYQGVIYVGRVPYKNIHCALCNYANLKEIDCHMLGIRTNIEAANFAKIFQFNIPESDEVQCRKGYIYDPVLEKCHSLSCLPFQDVKNGKCVPKA